MTPKEKAIELVDKYHKGEPYLSYAGACRCALIAVEEILDYGNLFDSTMELVSNCQPIQTLYYWEQVKIELTNL